MFIEVCRIRIKTLSITYPPRELIHSNNHNTKHSLQGSGKKRKISKAQLQVFKQIQSNVGWKTPYGKNQGIKKERRERGKEGSSWDAALWLSDAVWTPISEAGTELLLIRLWIVYQCGPYFQKAVVFDPHYGHQFFSFLVYITKMNQKFSWPYKCWIRVEDTRSVLSIDLHCINQHFDQAAYWYLYKTTI